MAITKFRWGMGGTDESSGFGKKVWFKRPTDPADVEEFATRESSEEQVRKDYQNLFNQLQWYLNEKLTEEIELYVAQQVATKPWEVTMPDGSIVTAKLADAAVNGTKLADNAVSSAKIANGSVTTEKLADGAVTAEKLPDGVIAEAKLADNAVTENKIADGAIVQEHFAPTVNFGNLQKLAEQDISVVTSNYAYIRLPDRLIDYSFLFVVIQNCRRTGSANTWLYFRPVADDHSAFSNRGALGRALSENNCLLFVVGIPSSPGGYMTHTPSIRYSESEGDYCTNCSTYEDLMDSQTHTLRFEGYDGCAARIEIWGIKR